MLAAALARRVVPEPWATGRRCSSGSRRPRSRTRRRCAPALTAGALLAGAALCALAVRERPLLRTAFGGAALLALLPWLDPWLLVPAAPVAVLLARWTARRGRAVVALGTVEVQLASLVVYVTVNDRLYGGFTPLRRRPTRPSPARAPSATTSSALPRLVGCGSTATPGCCAGRRCSRWRSRRWLLWRSRRERLARLVAEQRDVEIAALLALAVCAAQVAVAAFALARARGPVVPGEQLVAALPCAVPLVAWGLRHAPRVGLALGRADAGARALLARAACAWGRRWLAMRLGRSRRGRRSSVGRPRDRAGGCARRWRSCEVRAAVAPASSARARSRRDLRR